MCFTEIVVTQCKNNNFKTRTTGLHEEGFRGSVPPAGSFPSQQCTVTAVSGSVSQRKFSFPQTSTTAAYL